MPSSIGSLNSIFSKAHVNKRLGAIARSRAVTANGPWAPCDKRKQRSSKGARKGLKGAPWVGIVWRTRWTTLCLDARSNAACFGLGFAQSSTFSFLILLNAWSLVTRNQVHAPIGKSWLLGEISGAGEADRL